MRRAIIILSFLAICAVPHILYAQTFELESSILWSGANDIKVQGNYAFCAFDYGLMILDVSNPAQPMFVSKLPFVNGASLIELQGAYCFIASGGNLSVVDVHNPQNPYIISTWGNAGSVLGLILLDEYAYLISRETIRVDRVVYYRSYFNILNVANPETLILAGNATSTSYQGAAGGVAVAGNNAYVPYESYLAVYDISNPAHPVIMAQLGYGYNFGVDITALGTFAYIASNGYLRTIDISDPDSIYVANIDTIPGCRNIAINGGYAYLSCGNSPFQIYSILNPDNPSPVSSLQTQGSCLAADVAGGYVYIASDTKGIETISIDNPAEPQIAGGFDTPDRPEDCIVSGNYAYIANNELGLKIVDIADLNNPTIVGSHDTPGLAMGIAVEGNYCYIADSSFVIVSDVSDPNSPSIIGRVGGYWNAVDVAISGDYAYVADRGSCMRIVRIVDPRNPIQVGYYPTTGPVMDIAISGNYAYLASNGIKVLNLADPIHPLLADSTMGAQAVSIFVYDERAYLFDRELYGVPPYVSNSSLKVFNIINPYELVIHTIYRHPTSAGDFAISNGIGCTTTRSLYGNAILSAPSYENYNLIGSGTNIFVRGNDIFACAQTSFQIIRLNLTGIDDENPTPASFSLSAAYPNPFNSQTVLRYSLSKSEPVRLSIYDILGRKISTPIDQRQDAGEYSLNWNATGFPSGVYFARFEAGDKSETVKLLLLK